MSKYTTGELAKLCDVSVRTVQFYDTKGLLPPSALTEGGRRLYTDDDLIRLRLICMLKALGLTLDCPDFARMRSGLLRLSSGMSF